MSNYRVSPAARHDLDEIWDFIARDNPGAADNLLDELSERFRLISANKNIGATRSGFGEDIRIFPFNAYSIFYSPRGEIVEIVRVLHSARDAEVIFGTDLPN